MNVQTNYTKIRKYIQKFRLTTTPTIQSSIINNENNIVRPYNKIVMVCFLHSGYVWIDDKRYLLALESKTISQTIRVGMANKKIILQRYGHKN